MRLNREQRSLQSMRIARRHSILRRWLAARKLDVRPQVHEEGFVADHESHAEKAGNTHGKVTVALFG